MTIRRVKGCYDLLPGSEEPWKEISLWKFVEQTFEELAPLYGFSEIRTPIFEHTELFARSVGQDSDIVCKEMYTFDDKAGRSLSLRPECTASVLRAYIENHLDQKGTDRLYYSGPCFRYERAQKNRYRQFSQIGVEVIGSQGPLTDVESIALLMHFYKNLGLSNLKLLINSIGTPEIRRDYSQKLVHYFEAYKKDLSEDSQNRLLRSPMRILDSKDPRDQKITEEAPKLLDFLDKEAKTYFDTVCSYLVDLDIPFTIDTNLVRGLDYYTNTVFEVVATNDLAAQNTIGAGGCYNGLMKTLGGPDLPGTGWATGVERIINALLLEEKARTIQTKASCYCIPLSESCLSAFLPHVQKMRQKGIAATVHTKNFNLKKALQLANKQGASFALILGEEELSHNAVKIKTLETHQEKEVSLEHIAQTIQSL